MQYVIHFFGSKITDIIAKNSELVTKHEDFSMMKECHILLSVGKALCSHYGNECYFTMMQACGGHGF